MRLMRLRSLNDVISGVDTTTSIADAIAVRATMEDDVLGSNATPVAGHIMGGAGFGLIDVADGEVASPVNLGSSAVG